MKQDEDGENKTNVSLKNDYNSPLTIADSASLINQSKSLDTFNDKSKLTISNYYLYLILFLSLRSGEIKKDVKKESVDEICKKLPSLISSELTDLISQLHEEKHYAESQHLLSRDMTLYGEVVHPSTTCSICDQSPITGIRYKCAICPNYDLCPK